MARIYRQQLITEEAAREALGRYEGNLAESVGIGVDEWKKYHAPRYVMPYGRTFATSVHDTAMREISSRLGDDPNVVLISADDQRFFIHLKREGIVVRFKKFDESFRIANVRTEASIRFNAQGWLPGVPIGPRLTIGYQVDEVDSTLTGMYVALMVSSTRTFWRYEIARPGAIVQPLRAPELPLSPAAGSSKRAPRLVKPRQTKPRTKDGDTE